MCKLMKWQCNKNHKPVLNISLFNTIVYGHNHKTLYTYTYFPVLAYRYLFFVIRIMHNSYLQQIFDKLLFIKLSSVVFILNIILFNLRIIIYIKCLFYLYYYGLNINQKIFTPNIYTIYISYNQYYFSFLFTSDFQMYNKHNRITENELAAECCIL